MIMKCMHAENVPNKQHIVKCRLELFGGFPHTSMCQTCGKRESERFVFRGGVKELNDLIIDFISQNPLGTPLVIWLENEDKEIEKLVSDYRINGENIVVQYVSSREKADQKKIIVEQQLMSSEKSSKTGATGIVAGMITLNMGHFIENTINSVIDVVDKFVVLDGGSNDNTLDVLSSYSSKVDVIQYPWSDSFCAPRNVVIERVLELDAEWFLQIDSDEVMAPGFVDKIENILAKERGDVLMFPILWLLSANPPRYVASQYHTTLAPHRTRMWRCQNEMHFQRGRKVHELMETTWPNGRIVRIDDMDLAIHHHSYILNNYQARLDKIRFYDKIRAMAGSGEDSLPAYLYEHYPYEIRDLSVDFRKPFEANYEQSLDFARHQ